MIDRKILLQEIGKIIGFQHGTEMDALVDLFLRLLAEEKEER